MKKLKAQKTGGLKPWHLLVLIASSWAVFEGVGLFAAKPALSYTEFKQAVSEGHVESVVVSPNVISGTFRKAPGAEPDHRGFQVHRVEDPALVADLARAGVQVTGAPAPSSWSSMLWWMLLPLAFLLFMTGRGRDLTGGLMSVGRSGAKIYAETDVSVRFADVAGVDEAKEELAEVIEFLRTPEKFRRLGGKIPKGILLVGPPGTGKTLLARAVAGEAQVPFFSISGSEFVEMFVGVGAARVRDLFNNAKQKAPCIIFIDELDALGKARGLGPTSNEEREQTLNQLLVELDGFDPRAGVILMAATNRPEVLDPALLRAGRFDRHVLVDRPDKKGRVAILKIHARKVPLDDEADLDWVAGMTAGMAGADMANIVNEAALQAARHGKEKVGRAELEEAVERTIAGLAKKNRALNPEEKRRVAHHEVGHALVATCLPGADPVRKISILPRGISALGYTIQLPTEDRFLMTKTELENRIAVFLGGRVAEELVFGELSTGAQDDLVKATNIARGMVKAYGMSEALGPISLEPEPSPFLGDFRRQKGEHSEAMARDIDAEVRRILEEQHQRVAALLRQRLPLLRHIAAQLLERESLSGEQLRELAGAPASAPADLRPVALG
ncbi:MAG: ATP-dependent zinc metalloprotease FtsH [Myxococcota bacterium]